jgi:RND family efflux transporter MFP subunit
LLAAGGLAAVWFFTEPTAKRSGASKKTAMLVDVVEVNRGTYRPNIAAQGTVEASKDIVLRPQVGGLIEDLDSSFVPGGQLDKGEQLLRIQQADYRNTLAQRKSELREAQSQLAVEKGRHQAAMAEYERFGEKLPPEKKARVLRKPQLQAAKERVNAARAAVDQAKLDLRRTTVEAPFDARVIRRDINVGSEVAQGDSLGRLIGIDEYWVGVEFPLSKLQWLRFPGKENEGARAKIRNQEAWPAKTHRTGRLFKRVGVLDEDTRMARVLVAVDDPLALDKDSEKPPLTIGEFVEVEIRGKKLQNVMRLDRDYLRQDETVWVMEDEKLRVKEVDVVVRDEHHAYISEGLTDGAKVVATNISTVVEGAPLRLSSDEEDGSDE